MKEEFWAIPKSIFEKKELSLEARILYGILFTRANGENMAWPGQKSMADNLGVSERGIRRYLDELKKAGLIKSQRLGMKKTNRYFVIGQVGRSREDTAVADQDRTPVSDPIVKEQLEKNSSNTAADKPPRTLKEKTDPNEPMDWNQFYAWCLKSSQKHIKIIGEWADTTRPDLKTRGQWDTFIKRHLRAARDLEPFTEKQLSDAFDKIEDAHRQGWLKKYTLDTLIKFIV